MPGSITQIGRRDLVLRLEEILKRLAFSVKSVDLPLKGSDFLKKNASSQVNVLFGIKATYPNADA